MSFRLFDGVVCLALAGAIFGQAPPPAPADTPGITAKLGKLRAEAAPAWETAFHFWCEAPRANRDDDAEIPASRIFDNVYAIGNTGTVAYVVRTSAGLVMIDTLPANKLESQLLPGFQKLGLDPAQVKIILVSHGHADHYGNSPYFQQKFDTRIYVSGPDWQMIERPPAAGKAAPAIPRHDGELKDGEKVTLGDTSFTAVAVGGHTPGSMGFIFPVKDGARMRTVALFGGAWLTTGLLTPAINTQFLASINHFREATKEAKAEVMLMNHPLMMPLEAQLAKLAARKPNEANPFVNGQASVQKFIDVFQGCTEVAALRRALSVNK